MRPSAIVCAIAAASLGLGAVSAFAQGRVYDRNASNNPEIYRHPHPEGAAAAQNPQGQSFERRDQRHHDRAETGRREQQRRDAERREHEQRQAERRVNRHGYGHGHGYGHHADRHYVTPRTFYYSPPQTYYRAPQTYYGVPQTYYGVPQPYYDAPQTYYSGSRGPEFHRGGYLPHEYRTPQYYVNDWYGHQLYAPPYGHQWLQVGTDYVLVALATGLIANLILNR